MLLIILVHSLLSNRNKQNFYKLSAPNILSKDRIWIRPMSLKHFLKCLFIYLCFLVFFIASLVLVITISNILAIIFAIIFGFCLSIINAIYVGIGSTTVKFKKK